LALGFSLQGSGFTLQRKMKKLRHFIQTVSFFNNLPYGAGGRDARGLNQKTMMFSIIMLEKIKPLKPGFTI
jgi:hypothetical protein